jgi:hypothetical protein
MVGTECFVESFAISTNQQHISSMDVYTQLAEALRERLRLIADHDLRQRDPEQQLKALQHASERIDTLKTQLPDAADPRLVHYLDRMSLSKALEWIEQQHPANGHVSA